MRLTLLVFVFILFYLAAVPLSAQRYRFREYRQENGLGNLATTAMLQDRDHYLWIGTQNGLFRYDAQRMVHFGRSDGLPGAYILSLAQSPDGTLWVNTHLGIARLQAGRFIPEYAYSQAAYSPGMGMVVNSNGDLFVSGSGGVVIGRRTGKSFTYVFSLAYLPSSLRSKTIFQMVTDKQQQAWFGCGRGICSLTPEGKLQYHQQDRGIPEDQWDGIAIDRRETLWVRSNSRLLYLRKGASRFESVLSSLNAFGLAFIFAGNQDRLYLPASDGLWVHQDTSQPWRRISNSSGIGSEPITSILSDHADNLWIGYLGDGVARWLGHDEWEGWTKQEGLNSNTVWSVLRDGRHTLWAGTDNGLNYFVEAAQQWRSLGGEAGKHLGPIMSLAMDSPTSFWASSRSIGLLHVDTVNKTYRVFGFPAGASIQSLYSVFLDRDRGLWLGTSSGLFRATEDKPGTWEAIGLQKRESAETIYTVSQDSRGRIWAAGNAGLVVREGTRWRRFDSKAGLLASSTWFARETAKDTISVGYLEGVGETRIHWSGTEPSFEHNPNVEAPTGYMHYFSGLDKSGLLWSGTDRGVFVSNGKKTLLITDQDGLIWNDCNSNAFFADDDGSVWIGTARGLAHGRLRNPMFIPVPSLRLNSIRVNGKPVDPSLPLHVPHTPNEVEVDVSALDFRYENRISYQFRLGQEDDPWATRNSGLVSFTGIPGGANRFEARVKIGQQPWSKTLIEIPFDVAVPLWQSWAGRALFLLIGLLTIVLFWRYRNKQLIAEKNRLEAAVAARTGEIERLLVEAREANRLKSEFLATMSHEIRTPMNGVLGMLQLAASTRLDIEQQGFVDLAKSSAENLLSLLNEILDLSKVESGYLELESSAFCLPQAVQSIAALLEAAATNKAIQFEVIVDCSVPEWVVGDRKRLQQVLLNLVGNAIKFTDSGFVRLKLVSATPELVSFSVEDSGIGIPLAKQELIFDAFRQADGSTTRRFGGTGLGLAISRSLVELMGGALRVESEAGAGSRFYFEIRMKATVAELDAPMETTDFKKWVQRPLYILLAEDNRVNQLVVTKMLERDGHSVELVQDGAMAFEASANNRFDLILMDIHMPVLDGLRATLLIREREGRTKSYVPIVALSAGVLQEEQTRCIEAGMDAFLAKPLHLQDLRDTLARLTDPVKNSKSKSTPMAE